jgi:amino-acid N-acetyltransferase
MDSPSNPSCPRIRSALPSDTEGLYRLSQGLVATGALRNRSRLMFDKAIEDFIAAELDGRIIGCVGVCVLAGNPAAAVLYNLCVGVPHQRKGLGSRLVAAAVHHAVADGAQLLYTATVRTDGWFERHAFRPVPASQAPSSWVACLDDARNSSLYVRMLAQLAVRADELSPAGCSGAGE